MSAAWPRRLALPVACLSAALWGFYLYARYSETVYWNYADSTHIYYYLQPALYAVASLSALAAIGSRIRAPQTAGPWFGRWSALALGLLTGLTLWACLSTLGARSFAV